MSNRRVICVFASILLAGLLLGCGGGGQETKLPTRLSTLSLLELWETTIETTGIQGPSANLDVFHLSADRDGAINRLDFQFHAVDGEGRRKRYSVQVSPKGRLDWHADAAPALEATLYPRTLFEELAHFGLQRFEPGAGGIRVQVDFSAGDAAYTSLNNDIFVLDQGTSVPLRAIIFHSDKPWAKIQVCEADREAIVSENLVIVETGATALRQDPQCGVWFLARDLSKAQTVNYAQ